MNRILVVEDEDIIRKGLIFTADWTGHHCVVVGEATDGREGLEKIRELRPDIVVTDVRMPVMSGIEMLEASIREYGYSAIVLSGYGEFEYAQKAIRLGVTEYLLKPLDFSQLYMALDKIGPKAAGDPAKAPVPNLTEALLDRDVLEGSPKSKKYVDEMLGYIKSDYSRRISLTDLSARFSVSCTHLNALFKAETGYTFNDFLNRYRMTRAVGLLREERLKVYEVAELVGFSDYKYFIKVFKKYIGCSPAKLLSEHEISATGKEKTNDQMPHHCAENNL